MPAPVNSDNNSDSARRERPAAQAASNAGLPVVAIVGRPNAGKSTLFNRLVREQRAIVDSRPGVTRDRNIAAARRGDRRFLLVDTGGFEDSDDSDLAAAVRSQSLLAAEEADAVIVLLDGREGLNPLDRDLMERVRRLPKPVLFAVNKLDTHRIEDAAAEFYALGATEVFPISAAHGIGVGDLMDRLVELLPGAEDAPDGDEAAEGDAEEAPAPTLERPINLAIVGRPNVGKSSLLNRIVGYKRAIVDATAGTTRDPLDTPFRRDGTDYVLVDTAGIRRRPRVHEGIERASVVRALRALERAEVGVLVLDATQGMTDQDARIAGYAWERGRALLIAANKWDAVPRPGRDRRLFAQRVGEQYPTLAHLPVVCLSALTGSRVGDLFTALAPVVAAHRATLRTPELNRVLEGATRMQVPASVKGKRPRLFYATQTGTAPPAVTVFCSHPEAVQPAYERYLTNTLREAFGLQGTPLRVRFRERHDRERHDRERRGRERRGEEPGSRSPRAASGSGKKPPSKAAGGPRRRRKPTPRKPPRKG